MKTPSILALSCFALLLGACGGIDKKDNAAVDFPSRRFMYAIAPTNPTTIEQHLIHDGKISGRDDIAV